MSIDNRPAPHLGILGEITQHVEQVWRNTRDSSNEEHQAERFALLATRCMLGKSKLPMSVFVGDPRTYQPPAPLLGLLRPWIYEKGGYHLTWEDADKAYKAYLVAQALKSIELKA